MPISSGAAAARSSGAAAARSSGAATARSSGAATARSSGAATARSSGAAAPEERAVAAPEERAVAAPEERAVAAPEERAAAAPEERAAAAPEEIGTELQLPPNTLPDPETKQKKFFYPGWPPARFRAGFGSGNAPGLGAAACSTAPGRDFRGEGYTGSIRQELRTLRGVSEGCGEGLGRS